MTDASEDRFSVEDIAAVFDVDPKELVAPDEDLARQYAEWERRAFVDFVASKRKKSPREL